MKLQDLGRVEINLIFIFQHHDLAIFEEYTLRNLQRDLTPER